MSREHYKPEDFYDEAPPRTIGAECEYNIDWMNATLIDEPDFVEFVNEHTLSAIGLAHVRGPFQTFLSNGGVLYNDSDSIAEYASAEAAGPRQAVLTDFAGGVVIGRCIHASGLKISGLHRRSGTSTRPYDYRTTGYHENYLIPQRLVGFDLSIIQAHLSTRVWAGGGISMHDGYHLSQKHRDVGDLGQHKSTEDGKKTMFNQYAIINAPPWIRFENRSGDPLRSPIGRFAAFGSTSLVLRLIEHPDEHSLDYGKLPVNPLSVMNRGMRMDALDYPFGLIDRTQSTALSVQQMLINAAEELSQHIDLPADELIALRLWQDIIDGFRDLEVDSFDSARAAALTDCAAKYRLLLQRYGEDLGNHREVVVANEMAWDDLTKPKVANYWDKMLERHPYLRLKQLGQHAVDHYVHQPPHATSAKQRGSVIRRGVATSAGWSSYTDDQAQTIGLPPSTIK